MDAAVGDSETGNAADWFIDRHIRAGRGAAPVFADPWRRLDYRSLQEATARCAGALAAAGIGRERRFALVMLDTVDFPVAFWGAIRAGVVPVPVNTLLTPDQIGYILADSRAEAVAVSAPLLPALRPVLARHSPKLVLVVEPDGGVPDLADGELDLARS